MRWIRTVGRDKAHFRKKAKPYVPRLVRASLANHPKIVAFISERFGVDLHKLANEDTP